MALLAAPKQKRLPCYVLPDGMTIRVDTETAYEPNALVYCGKKLPASTIEVPEPIILVEVLSTEGIVKLDPPGLELAVNDIYGT